MATSTNTLSMKLLVDSKSQRVLFAEAGKDVVAFLFSLLALPAATAVKLIGNESMVGSFGNLYSSVEKLDSTYVLPGAAKTALLRPTAASPAVSTNSSLLLLPPSAPKPEQPKTLYRCTNNYSYSSSCRNYITDVCGKECKACGHKMVTSAEFLTSAAGSSGSGSVVQQSTGKGFVQGIVTYTVLDDLTVTPMSAISSITLLNTFAVDLSVLREKTVQIGYEEGVDILKASLQSKTVLTDVFLARRLDLILPGASGAG